jgi:hypothetical protein
MKAREHKEGCMTKLGGALMSAVLWTTIGPAYVTTGKNNEYSATFTGKLDKQGRTIAGTWRLVDNLGKRSGKFTARKR